LTPNRRTTQERSVRSDAMPSMESLSPKRFFDFLTDPSLLITVLHSLEVAYWTFPFGFILTPVINFFRVPNRRRSLELSAAEKIMEKLYSQEVGSNRGNRGDDHNNFFDTWRRMQSMPHQQQQQLHDLYVKFLKSLAQQQDKQVKYQEASQQLSPQSRLRLQPSTSTIRLRK
jgi:hypothetical protein